MVARSGLGAWHVRAREESTFLPVWICSSQALGSSLGLSLHSSWGKHIPTLFPPALSASKIFAAVEDCGGIFSTLQRSIPIKDLCGGKH